MVDTGAAVLENSPELTVFNGHLYFRASNDSSFPTLWKTTDGLTVEQVVGSFVESIEACFDLCVIAGP